MLFQDPLKEDSLPRMTLVSMKISFKHFEKSLVDIHKPISVPADRITQIFNMKLSSRNSALIDG